MSAQQCELLRQLSSSVAYQVLISVKGVLCVLGAVGICYQWRTQGVRFLVHDNTKVLFTFYYLLNFFVATDSAFTYFFEFIRLRLDCFMMNFSTVLLTRGLAMSIGISAHNIIMLISIERLYSSLYPAKFEKQSNKTPVFILSVVVIIATLAFVMSSLSDGFTLFGPYPVAFMEEVTPANSNSFGRVPIFVGVSNVLSICIFCVDLYLNYFRKPKAAVSPSLSISYQRVENRQIINFLLPIEIIETVLTFAKNVGIFFHETFVDFSKPIDRLIYMDLFTLPVLFPLLIAIIIEIRVARKVKPSVTNAHEEFDHFESLRQAWK